MLLKYTGADFKEVFYTVYCVKDEGPIMERFNIDGWLSDKFSLGLDYPNVMSQYLQYNMCTYLLVQNLNFYIIFTLSEENNFLNFACSFYKVILFYF